MNYVATATLTKLDIWKQTIYIRSSLYSPQRRCLMVQSPTNVRSSFYHGGWIHLSGWGYEGRNLAEASPPRTGSHRLSNTPAMWQSRRNCTHPRSRISSAHEAHGLAFFLCKRRSTGVTYQRLLHRDWITTGRYFHQGSRRPKVGETVQWSKHSGRSIKQ